MSLILVADAAYPFDLRKLPAGVRAVAGYCGGATPHAWTTSEIETVERSGRQWWAIWTAPNSQSAPHPTLTAAQGARDAAEMIAALNARGYSTSRPVFYDVEISTFYASAAGSRAAIAAWQNAMRAAGWTRAYAYQPWQEQAGWVAQWTGNRPGSLPAGVIGWQYTSDQQLGKPFDLSVFDSALLAPGVPLMALTDQQQTDLYNRIMGFDAQRWYVVNKDGTITNVPQGTAGALPAHALDTEDGNYLVLLINALAAQNSALASQLSALQAQVKALQPASGGGLTAAQVQAATETGMKAIFAKAAQ